MLSYKIKLMCTTILFALISPVTPLSLLNGSPSFSHHLFIEEPDALINFFLPNGIFHENCKGKENDMQKVLHDGKPVCLREVSTQIINATSAMLKIIHCTHTTALELEKICNLQTKDSQFLHKAVVNNKVILTKVMEFGHRRYRDFEEHNGIVCAERKSGELEDCKNKSTTKEILYNEEGCSAMELYRTCTDTVLRRCSEEAAALHTEVLDAAINKSCEFQELDDQLQNADPQGDQLQEPDHHGGQLQQIDHQDYQLQELDPHHRDQPQQVDHHNNQPHAVNRQIDQPQKTDFHRDQLQELDPQNNQPQDTNLQDDQLQKIDPQAQIILLLRQILEQLQQQTQALREMQHG